MWWAFYEHRQPTNRWEHQPRFPSAPRREVLTDGKPWICHSIRCEKAQRRLATWYHHPWQVQGAREWVSSTTVRIIPYVWCTSLPPQVNEASNPNYVQKYTSSFTATCTVQIVQQNSLLRRRYKTCCKKKLSSRVIQIKPALSSLRLRKMARWDYASTTAISTR